MDEQVFYLPLLPKRPPLLISRYYLSASKEIAAAGPPISPRVLREAAAASGAKRGADKRAFNIRHPRSGTRRVSERGTQARKQGTHHRRSRARGHGHKSRSEHSSQGAHVPAGDRPQRLLYLPSRSACRGGKSRVRIAGKAGGESARG